MDDTRRLERVVNLLESEEVRDDEAAIRVAAEEDPGDSAKSTRRRLRRKLPAYRAEVQKSRERASKREILNRAFAESVETWDL